MGFGLQVRERECFDLTRESLQTTLTDLSSFSHWFPWVNVGPTAEFTADGQAGSVGQSLHFNEKTVGSVSVVLRSLLTQSARTIVKCDLHLDGEVHFSGECVFQLEERSDQNDSKACVLEWRVVGSVPFWSMLARKLHEERLLRAVKRGIFLLRSYLATAQPVQAIGAAEVAQTGSYHLVTLAENGHVLLTLPGDRSSFDALAEVLQERNHPAPDFWVLQFDAPSLLSERVTFRAAACYGEATVFTVQQPLVRSEISVQRVVRASYTGHEELLGGVTSYLRNYLRVNKLEPAPDFGPTFVVSRQPPAESIQPPVLSPLSGEMRVPLKSPKN